jgi:hypothetical protein
MSREESPPEEPSSASWARRYAKRGWCVIPLRPRSKQPAIRWAPYQQRLATADEIDSWFAAWPGANVGIVTGAISGLVVFDVDLGHGGDDSLAELERAHGPLPKTVEALTGGGGRHVYFAHPGGAVRNKVGIAQGLDLRGDGGYVVAPPSVHPSGRRYEWEASRHPDEISLAPLPDWLLNVVAIQSAQLGHPLSHWRALVREGVAQGERNNTIASFTGHLLWHGVDPEVVLDLMLCWNARRCRPPLSEDEVARTVESIVHTHARHLGESG